MAGGCRVARFDGRHIPSKHHLRACLPAATVQHSFLPSPREGEGQGEG